MIIRYLIAFLFLASVLVRADDQWNGQPVGPNLTPDDASAYVESVLKGWASSSDGTSKIRPDDMIKLAAAIKPLGVANLLAAYSHTAPDTEYRSNTQVNPEDEAKRAVLEKALSQSATTSDLDALLAVYDSRPLILSVLSDHPEWDNESKVIDFLAAHLDQLADAYKQSDRAPTTLLVLAARSPAASVQSKLDSVISAATQNDANYSNAHLYVDIIYAYAQTASPTIGKHLPDVFTVLANRAKVAPSDIYNEVAVRDVFNKTWWALQFGKLGGLSAASTALFADQKSKDAVTKMADEASNDNYNGMQAALALVPAAACGNKSALKQVVELGQGSGGGPSSMNAAFAKKYLDTIKCSASGDRLKQITSHIDDATYDSTTCVWTIPGGQ